VRAIVRRATSPILPLALAAALLAGCSAGAPVSAPVPDTPLAPVPPPPVPLPPIDVDWARGEVPLTTLVDGRTIRPCDGDAPVLCVHDHTGVLAGRVELGRWPAPDGDADPQGWLRRQVDGFVAGLAADRTATCGDGYVVSLVDTPIAGEVDGAPAVTYRYVGVRSGTELERGVTTLVHRPGEVLAIAAVAYDAEGCVPAEAGDFHPADLETFEAALDAVVRGSELP
jgi:hypothetical protein